MLRAKKIIAYVTDRIDPDNAPDPDDPQQSQQPSEDSTNDQPLLKPEDYIDLICHDQRVPHDMTLATLRAHVWKTGGDVVVYYRSNGRKPRLEREHRERMESAAAAAAQAERDSQGPGIGKEEGSGTAAG